jgi:hypothetical protein
VDATRCLTLAGTALGRVGARQLDEAARVVEAGRVSGQREQRREGGVPDAPQLALQPAIAGRLEQLDHPPVELGDGGIRQGDPLRGQAPAEAGGRGSGRSGTSRATAWRRPAIRGRKRPW